MKFQIKFFWRSENFKVFLPMEMLIFLFTSLMRASLQPYFYGTSSYLFISQSMSYFWQKLLILFQSQSCIIIFIYFPEKTNWDSESDLFFLGLRLIEINLLRTNIKIPASCPSAKSMNTAWLARQMKITLCFTMCCTLNSTFDSKRNK